MHVKGQLRYVLELQARKYGAHLVVYCVIFALIALGVVIGFSFLMGTPSGKEMLYLATGAPTLVVVMTALVTVPMQNAGARLAGYTDFIKTLPVSRKQFLFAEVIIWTAITLPGIAISTLVAHLTFHPGFSISWTVVPSYALIIASCFGIGYGYSFVMQAEHAMALSQVIAFTALMFSPLYFPLERLPGWLQVVHLALPLHHMANVMRASLAHETFQAHPASYVILAAWSVLGFAGAIRFLERA